jgi:hypothetical protein
LISGTILKRSIAAPRGVRIRGTLYGKQVNPDKESAAAYYRTLVNASISLRRAG